MGSDLYLGVDGGQSSTAAVVGDSAGSVLGKGVGGPCNHARRGEGRAKLELALSTAVGQALQPLGLTLAEVHFRRVCIGMSGGPDDKREIIRGLIPADSYDITTDAHVALFGAVGGGAGAIVISGTGSIALSRDARGRIWRAGGWGYVFGDEGSGFDIGRNALRAALQAEEGWGDETNLRRLLLDITGAASANDLLHRFYAGEFSRHQAASWTRLVQTAADQGDQSAAAILDQAGKELAHLAAAAARSASLTAGKALICPIGGVFDGPRVSAAFASGLEQLLSVAPSPPEAAPEVGALNAAVQGVSLDPV